VVRRTAGGRIPRTRVGDYPNLSWDRSTPGFGPWPTGPPAHRPIGPPATTDHRPADG